jgi:hypothetical protein
MKTTLISLAAVAVLALVTGCVAPVRPSSAQLTYETKPEGATLYEGGVSIGVAPVTRTYNSDGKSPQITTPEVTAVWPSGAKTGFYTVLDIGADRQTVLERPAKAPNLQADLDNAAKLTAERDLLAKRSKEEIARDVKRNSARCKAQQQSGNVATNDC